MMGWAEQLSRRIVLMKNGEQTKLKAGIKPEAEEPKKESNKAPNLKDFDIQEPDYKTPARLAEPETIKGWRPATITEVISITIMSLFVLWVVVGLIYFVITGVAWLLLATPILGYPLRRVIDYHLPKVRKPIRRRSQRRRMESDDNK